jgi:hypothetical protein
MNLFIVNQDPREKDINRFYTIDEINPNLKIIVDHFDEIREEFLQNKDKLTWTNWHAHTGYLGDRAVAYAGWQIAAVFAEMKDNADLSMQAYLDNLDILEQNYGMKLYPNVEEGICYSENKNILPKFTKYLREAGVTKRGAIGVVHPGKEIKWHIDPDPEVGNNAIIRGLWGLDIVPEEGKSCYLGFGTPEYHVRQEFKNGEVTFFYGRIPHCVVNELSTPRYVIVLDHDVDKDYLVDISQS